jgi:hypothetical protein
MPANRVKQPMSQAIEKRVSAGLQMHTTPSTMNNTPVMTSQIFEFFFITV